MDQLDPSPSDGDTPPTLEDLTTLLDQEMLAELRRQYTTEPVPPCRVCGAELTIQSIGAGVRTKYGHSTPPGVSFAEWAEHYRESTWSPRFDGDYRVIALLDAYTALTDPERTAKRDRAIWDDGATHGIAFQAGSNPAIDPATRDARLARFANGTLA